MQKRDISNFQKLGDSKKDSNLRTHWRLSTILKTSNKSLWTNVFWYVKVCIFWKCIQYTTLYIEIKQMLKKFLRTKQTVQKMILICDSYMSWSTRFVSLKLCVEFSIFDSVSFLLKFIFFFQRNEWTLIIPFIIKIIQKPHTVLLPNLWFLSFNKKF